jgi:hypothetical protein
MYRRSAKVAGTCAAGCTETLLDRAKSLLLLADMQARFTRLPWLMPPM